MNSPRFTGKEASSFSLNGSTPSTVSRRLTIMAKHSESKPRSSSGNSSDSGPSRWSCSCATWLNWSRICDRTLMHEFSAGSVFGWLGTRISSPGDSGGSRFRLWPDSVLDQSAKKGYSLEEIRIRLGWRQRNLSSQDLEEARGVLDIADTM